MHSFCFRHALNLCEFQCDFCLFSMYDRALCWVDRETRTPRTLTRKRIVVELQKYPEEASEWRLEYFSIRFFSRHLSVSFVEAAVLFLGISKCKKRRLHIAFEVKNNKFCWECATHAINNSTTSCAVWDDVTLQHMNDKRRKTSTTTNNGRRQCGNGGSHELPNCKPLFPLLCCFHLF